MPEEQNEFQGAVASVLEAVMFENWLRFYFISEKPEESAPEDGEAPLFMGVPVKGMERIAELYPHLLPMADAMNGKEVTFETSQRAICSFIAAHVEGKSIARESAAMIFNSASFQVQMQLFNTWVQIHEDQLDRAFTEFGAWRKLFDEWRQSPGARELAEKLTLSLQAAASGSAKETVQ